MCGVNAARSVLMQLHMGSVSSHNNVASQNDMYSATTYIHICSVASWSNAQKLQAETLLTACSPLCWNRAVVEPCANI